MINRRIHSISTRNKIKLALMGHLVSEKTRKKQRMAKLGKHLSDDHKRKIGDASRGHIVSEKVRREIGDVHRGMIHSKKSRKMMSITHKKMYALGINRPPPRKGIRTSTTMSQKEYERRVMYSSIEWQTIRKQVYKRDRYTCQICGIRFRDHKGNGMNAHHIIPYRINKDNSLENLITLCNSCHRKEEVKYYNSIKV